MTLKPTVGIGTELEWTKSSYSSNEGPDCVEVAATLATILVRDSKDTRGPQLTFAPAAWSAFVCYAAEH